MLRNITLALLLIFVFLSTGWSQTTGPVEECGTVLTPAQERYLNSTRHLRQNSSLLKSGNSRHYVPVQHHIVRRSDGTGGMDPLEIPKIMTELNHYYGPINLYFFECGAVDFIDDNTYFDFQSSQEGALCGANDVNNVLNIYYFNTVKSGGSALCGYSYFPPSNDRVIMDKDCAINGSTIIHEIGHYFTLYHTHGKSNNGTTDELVDGSNCSIAGDDICDTPADPNLNGVVNTSCGYTGTSTDSNSQPYVPQTNNIMSYSRKQCRQLLTSQQLTRALAGAQLDRSYLACFNPPAPTAEFEMNTTQSCDGVVQFFDRSTSVPTVWVWDFGDGQTSNDQDPIHIYKTNGTYTISLSVINPNGNDMITKSAALIVNLPASPSVSAPDSVCKGESAKLSTGGGSTAKWYDSDTSTVPVAVGHIFNTPKLNADATYFVSTVYQNALFSLGPASPSVGSTFTPSNYRYLIFDAFKPLVLKSVTVNASTAGPRTFELRTNLGLRLQEITVNLATGTQTVNLNFNVPAGVGLQLGTSVISESRMTSNSSGITYPYALGTLASITGSSTGSSDYYYFYDWKIKPSDCLSARTEVIVKVRDCVSGFDGGYSTEGIQIVPNPTTGVAWIEMEDWTPLEVRVLTMTGTEIMNTALSESNNRIDLTAHPDGVYFVSMQGNGVKIVRRLVKSASSY